MMFDYEAYVQMSEEERNKKFPHTKVRIPGESLWARVLSPGVVMLDNNPLDTRYRYADVVEVSGRDVARVLERTFTQRFGFGYEWEEKGDDVSDPDMPARKDIAARCHTFGNKAHYSFFVEGMGFVSLQKDVDVAKLVEVLTAGDSPIIEIVNLDQDEVVEIYQKESNHEHKD